MPWEIDFLLYSYSHSHSDRVCFVSLIQAAHELPIVYTKFTVY